MRNRDILYVKLRRQEMLTPRRVVSARKARAKPGAVADEFKNPLLGIEVSLRKRLEEIAGLYKDTSVQKRDVLLDALEDVAATGLGFRKQIEGIVRYWRPPQPSREEVDMFHVTTVKCVLRAQRDCEGAAEKRDQKRARCEEMKGQLDDVEAANKALEDEISELEHRIRNESDHFAVARKVDREMRELRQSFAAMFMKRVPREEDQEIVDLAAENAQLKRDIARQRIELEICQKITEKLTVCC